MSTVDHSRMTIQTAPGGDVEELAALIEAGGLWRLAPDWVPRVGYAAPTPDTLRAVRAGLRGLDS